VDDESPKQRASLRFAMLNAFFDEGRSAAGLTLPAALVWLALYRHADPQGRVKVSGTRLQDMTGLAERTITYALGGLREKRMLKLLKRGGPGRGASMYVLSPVPRMSKAGKDNAAPSRSPDAT
jgi:hypothetical protein